MDTDKITVPELKAVLKHLGLPTKGNKPELLKRLFDKDPSGKIPTEGTLTEVEDATTQQQGEGHSVAMTEGEVEQTACDGELEILRREHDLMRRELEIMRRERELEANRTIMTASPATIASQASTTRSQPKAISELLSEFTGSEGTFPTWRKQFDLIRATYQLDDGTARIVIGMRLKQKALQWFHSRPEYLEVSVDELLEKMRIMFDHRPAKLDLRRRFEKRVWRNDETFNNYFYDKTILANKVPVDEDELVDYIIDGTDEITRNQARIQTFKTKEELLSAFGKITFQAANRSYARDSSSTNTRKAEFKRKTKQQAPSQEGQDNAEVKCYNCNQPGHVAKNCDKPRRERGSCYECGAADHRLRDCPRKKRGDNAERASTSRRDRTDLQR
ncbi:Gag-Pol polyprotein [Trachymyrmex cornetzi]|uniref:Gag-Pol polyprotein n=1 Tax=Trachymyrmex cornetzi TaxID=471704 RepID=A0A151JSN4_9HYME|nr:Gag-Pol polyprotein [Trachymyrmex cornetzi]